MAAADRVVEEAAAQLGLGLGAGSVSGRLGQPGHRRAAGHNEQQRHHRTGQRTELLVPADARVQEPGQQAGLGDDQRGGEHAEDHGEHEIGPRRPCVPQQTRIQRLHASKYLSTR